MVHTPEEKLEAISRIYRNQGNCAEAIFTVYREELAPSEDACETLRRQIYSCVGSAELPCCVFLAAMEILKRKHPGADEEDLNRTREKLLHIMRREYGGTTCREMLDGLEPGCVSCEMKVKDGILLIEQLT